MWVGCSLWADTREGEPSTEADHVDSRSFQTSPTQKTAPSGALGVHSPHRPPSLVTVLHSRSTRNCRSKTASLLVSPCQLPPPLHSPASFPNQLRLQGWALAPVSEPSSQNSRQQSQVFLFPSLFYLGVWLIYSVASVSQCWVLITCACTHTSSFLNSEPG